MSPDDVTLNAGGGRFAEWTTLIDAMLKIDFDTAIPGAGTVLTRADVQMFRTNMSTVITRATDLVRTGVAKEELLKQLKTDDIGWAPRVPQIDAFYEELMKSGKR